MFKVIRRFNDKYTGEKYFPGDSFKSDEAERIADLTERKLIEKSKRNSKKEKRR